MTNQRAGGGSEWVHGGKRGSEEGELLKGTCKHKTTPLKSQKTHQTEGTAESYSPLSRDGVFVKEREREEERWGGVCHESFECCGMHIFTLDGLNVCSPLL